jgi:phosphate uptake regulator
METRKLQKVGGSTYSVSIPKEWATEHRLEAGMPVHLYPHTDGSLIVRSAADDGGSLSAATVELPTANPDAVERTLRAAYTVGYDTLTLRAPADEPFTATERRAARRLVRDMVGLSVTEATADRLVVETLLDASEVSIRQSVVQLQFTALSMHRTAVERLERRAEGGTSDSDPLGGRGDEVDRLFAMLTRHFTRSLTDFEEVDRLDVSRSALFDYYLVACQLERVAGHAVHIGSLAEGVDPAADDVVAEIAALAEAARAVIETATEAVLERSADLAHEALDRHDALIDDARALDRTLLERSPAGAGALSRVLADLTRTADCGGDVARVALRAGVRPEA